jgi:hypothetical protein
MGDVKYMTPESIMVPIECARCHRKLPPFLTWFGTILRPICHTCAGELLVLVLDIEQAIKAKESIGSLWERLCRR